MYFLWEIIPFISTSAVLSSAGQVETIHISAGLKSSKGGCAPQNIHYSKLKTENRHNSILFKGQQKLFEEENCKQFWVASGP